MATLTCNGEVATAKIADPPAPPTRRSAAAVSLGRLVEKVEVVYNKGIFFLNIFLKEEAIALFKKEPVLKKKKSLPKPVAKKAENVDSKYTKF